MSRSNGTLAFIIMGQWLIVALVLWANYSYLMREADADSSALQLYKGTWPVACSGGAVFGRVAIACRRGASTILNWGMR
jgi:hypothetical protein